jgi:hypothetical protein
MGKANIIRNLGSGQYEVQPVYDDHGAKELMARYRARATDLTDNVIPATEEAISEANSAANATYNNLQRTTLQNPSVDALASATADYLLADAVLKQTNNKLTSTKLQLLAIQAKLKTLEALVLNEPLEVRCADCSRNLTGEVATIELYGLQSHMLIYPGFDSDAKFDHATHGEITPTAFLSPEAAFYNAAMFPGWQKWRPTYRVADIDNIYGDYCTVTIYDPRTNAEKGELQLTVDSELTFTGVPFNVKSYASTHFSVGDRVILRFVDQDYTNPEVFGFYTNPCSSTSTSTTSSTSSTTTTSSSSSSSSSTSCTSCTSCTTGTPPPDHWYTVQGESAPFFGDGAFYHFVDMAFDAGDLDHTDPPSPYGVAAYNGLTYAPTGYIALATNKLIKYDGDSNQTILSSASYINSYGDIAYDISNGKLVGVGNSGGDSDVYFYTGVNLVVDHSVTIPNPADLKGGTSATLGGVAIDAGTLLLTQHYTRNDDVLVYRLIRASYAGAILNIYHTFTISSDNVSNLCMSHGNTGTLLALKVNKSVDVYDTGVANLPTNYSISHLPPTIPPAGIATNILNT